MEEFKAQQAKMLEKSRQDAIANKNLKGEGFKGFTNPFKKDN